MKKLTFLNVNLKTSHRGISSVIDELADVEKVTIIRFIKNFKEETDYAFLINGIWYRIFRCSWEPRFVYSLELREIPDSAYRKEFCNNL